MNKDEDEKHEQWQGIVNRMPLQLNEFLCRSLICQPVFPVFPGSYGSWRKERAFKAITHRLQIAAILPLNKFMNFSHFERCGIHLSKLYFTDRILFVKALI